MSERLVMFVHGLGGSPAATWGNFEKLLLGDPELEGIKVAHFSYPTLLLRLPFWPRYPGIVTLARGLATDLANRYSFFTDVTLVCHSLGGLIARQYLIDTLKTNRQSRVKRALFYAVPCNGAALASVAEFISWRHWQLKQLCRDSDAIRRIAEDWERSNIDSVVDVRYIVAAQDRVVDEHSARQTWGNVRVDVVVDRNHINVVKPRDGGDLSYLILKNRLRKEQVNCSSQSMHVGPRRSPPQEGTCAVGPEAGPPVVEETRVSVSAILRIEQDGKFLLVRNLHRPELFAPFGGVYKFLVKAKGPLDRLSFRPEVVSVDMRGDLRGYIPSDMFQAFRDWFETGEDRENATDCLRRELREELIEVGLTADLVPPDLQFQQVRTVFEDPEFIPALGCNQFRRFDVFDLRIETAESKALFQALEEHVQASPNLLWVSAESAKRGRASEGQVIGHHTTYLFGNKRYANGYPLFATA